MIQRKQTIWFMLAAVCGFCITQVPLFIGTQANNVIVNLMATESLVLFALSMAVACLAAFCIFLFRNRSLQFKLAVTGTILSIAIIALEVWYIEQFKAGSNLVKGTYYWGGLLPIAMTVFFILAARGVYRDEKLIKSVDRLR
jgi:hypothetical protein